MNNNALELINLISKLTEDECIQLIQLYNKAVNDKNNIINESNQKPKKGRFNFLK